jgi:micrococcal nuclease
MSPENYRVLRTVILILYLMAFATVVLTLALFTFSRPAKGEVIDARKVFVIDGDTFALGGERIRLLGVDAPETREARCEQERIAGYRTKSRVVELVRFGGVIDIRRQGQDPFGRTLAHIVIDGRDLGDQLVREKLALPYRSGAEAKAVRMAHWCGEAH